MNKQGLLAVSNKDREDWLTPVYRDSTVYNRNKRENNIAINRQGFTVKHCKKCNISWEKKVLNGETHIFQYTDFPTYGLEKEICPCCHQDK